MARNKSSRIACHSASVASGEISGRCVVRPVAVCAHVLICVIGVAVGTSELEEENAEQLAETQKEPAEVRAACGIAVGECAPAVAVGMVITDLSARVRCSG